MNEAKPTSGWNDATPPTLPANETRQCACGRQYVTGTDTALQSGCCPVCAAQKAYYNTCADIFERERFPNRFEIVQQLMRWPWTLHKALDRWAKYQDQFDEPNDDSDDDTPEDRAVGLLGRLGWTCTPPKLQP